MFTEQLFITPRVVVIKPHDGGEAIYRVAKSAISTNGDSYVTIDYYTYAEVVVEVAEDITNNKNTGIITFSDLTSDYYIRPLREEDGMWLSKLKTTLPVEALMQIITWNQRNDLKIFNGEYDAVEEESLMAFTFNGGSIVTGLLYNDSVGRWLRVGEDWLLVNDIDDSMILDDAVFVTIDPEKADEFIALFDEKNLPINSIDEYTKKFETEEAPVEQ